MLARVCVCKMAVQRRSFSSIPHCRGKLFLSSRLPGATVLLVTLPTWGGGTAQVLQETHSESLSRESYLL